MFFANTISNNHIQLLVTHFKNKNKVASITSHHEKMTKRVNFASSKHTIEYPDFLEIQLKSFQEFFQLETTSDNRSNEGLFKVFSENFPITDSRNNFVLEFLDYFIDPPRYAIEECIERGLTYSVPLKAKLKLYCTDPNTRTSKQ